MRKSNRESNCGLSESLHPYWKIKPKIVSVTEVDERWMSKEAYIGKTTVVPESNPEEHHIIQGPKNFLHSQQMSYPLERRQTTLWYPQRQLNKHYITSIQAALDLFNFRTSSHIPNVQCRGSSSVLGDAHVSPGFAPCEKVSKAENHPWSIYSFQPGDVSTSRHRARPCCGVMACVYTWMIGSSSCHRTGWCSTS